jgi:alpha-beta hydrolase superfamily lysophospholipase
MRTVGRFLGRLVVLLAGIAAALMIAVWLWPAEPPLRPPAFDAAVLPDDLDRWLAEREATVAGITPGTEKRIAWAGTPGTRTPLAIVYLHGFSATSEEIRPVPDRVARLLGANLYYARLAGHGRDGAALAGASADDWLIDLAEALAVAGRIGERTVVIGTSTGATLAVAGLGDPAIAAALPGAERVAALALVSPNFRVRSAAARLLDLPLAEYWAPVVAGRERAFAPANEMQARYWTTRYPTAAVLPMARMVRAAAAVDPAGMRQPVLFVLSQDDQVVDPAATRALGARWGGPVSWMEVATGPGVDADAHVLAGDILSPAMTAPVADRIATFLAALPPR